LVFEELDVNKMSFGEIGIKSSYDSDDDDILNYFYNPVLANSVEYCRLAGFFSSSALAVTARGIQGLLKNNGKMKLVAGAVLSKKDVDAIKEGLESPQKVIERAAIHDFDSIEDEFVRDHVMALGWLVAKKKLEIRVAIVEDKNGLPLDAKTILQRGIFHQKVGIFTDTNGRRISFSGSINETARAWSENIEEFKIFREWVEAEHEHFLSDYKKFNKYWNGESQRVKIIEATQAIKERLIQMAPDTIGKLKLEPRKKVSKITVEPWSHQKEAVSTLKNNSYCGIFKMATGTGKTFTALISLEQYFKDIKKYGNRILIIVPQHNLVEQWVGDLRDFLKKDFISSYDSKTLVTDRRDARKIWMSKLTKDENFNIYLVITVDSIMNFNPFNRYAPDFIIGDEVHSYGTENRMRTLKGYLGNVKYRLGLSATPERYYDPDGTERIFNYFNPIIYEYGMKEAQEDRILSKYNYYPFLVELTPQEEKKIEGLTKKIGKEISIDFKNELSEKEKILSPSANWAIQERARIIKKAENKIDTLRTILEKNKGKLKQCIVYCEDTEQLDAVKKVFDELKIDSYVIYHSKIKNREEALNLFKNKNCNFILSMHCLDQGVNIPSCESLILLSSSGNPREYIQRRGRVLRNPQNKVKPIVKIFDILAFPRNLEEMYRGLVMTQLVRAWEFISCSQSPDEKMKLTEILSAYEIYSEELDRIIEEW
jgi:superfamily II DNA or RNA helicase